jgi:hypothetical protein
MRQENVTMKSGTWIVAVAALTAAFVAPTSLADPPHNVILFVPDGLRAQAVDTATAPAMAQLRDQGVNFTNSHSVFPTFTTANASAFATGHQLGDSGDFSNDIYSGFPIASSANTVTPFLESDPVLRDLNRHFPQGYLDEASIIALASNRYSTAAIGKLGPVAIFDLNAMNPRGDERFQTLIVDDETGHDGGVMLSRRWTEAFERAGVAPSAPDRGANGNPGGFNKPGAHTTNAQQQHYFLDVALKVVLPEFKRANRPFALVYWSRDPDGTQHNQGDSFDSTTPGINGPNSMAAIRSADDALAAIEAALKDLGLFDSTNIIVAADHGFSTISKTSQTSVAASKSYGDVLPHELPLGFLAIDLAAALQRRDPALKLLDPDDGNAEVNWNAGQHPRHGNGVIARDPASPKVIIASNGGSDLLYLPDASSRSQMHQLGVSVVEALMAEDYVSGVFVNEKQVGRIPGSLPTSAIALEGNAVTPHPSIVVNFKSFSTACGRTPILCAAEVADSALQQGQGMHGSFSRADTWNFMAARGPDFNSAQVDYLPASNADVGQTIAHLLQLELPAKGALTGRVLSESLQGGKVNIESHTSLLESEPASSGLKTVLLTQRVGSAVYFDVAGFPGRTVGLNAH